ncbi:cystathionine gamma-lyase-like [Hyposmocoma kahamanoa]|uniref:cystathionine gamma-lyase-like n=1 Tax=Hyposmocoma kahamanoa TaxID=1477025 RepID=UPI000E6D679D|nr:cystathionine gamma-lyase-like [Hyposmocoma kahamanoa]
MADGFLAPKAGFATKAIHAGHNPSKWYSSPAVVPIVTSTTYKQRGPNDNDGFVYGRSANPTRNSLQDALAALDGGKHALAFPSGLGATTVLVSLLKHGDHILSCDDLYGGTNRLLRNLCAKMDIELTFADFTNIDNVKNGIKNNTRMIWLESPTNPSFKVIDIAAVKNVANTHKDIIVIVDNTFLTPYLQRPLDFGADVVVYSLTKYMNGHTDIIMGAAVVNDDELAEKLKFLRNALGVVPSPYDCYMVNRSLKTLALRMEQHKKSSLAIAKWLQKHPNVTEVLHPGLPTHPQYALTQKQTSGHSGVFSFKHSGGLKESRQLLQKFKLFLLAESLGGCESLASLPSLMTHASVSAEQRAELGITDSLVRLSVGLEDTDDLLEDLKQAFKAVF